MNKNSMNLVKKFFSDLLKSEQYKTHLKDVIFIEGSTQKGGPMHTVKVSNYTDLWNWMNNCENRKVDAYFYINGGGTKVRDINKIRSFYVDLDAGRDKQGKYLSKELVDKKKASMYRALTAFKRIPTYIVETRNGYQVYWFVFDKTINNEDFVKTQFKLWNKFKKYGADSYCLRPNQFFRIPTSSWFKTYENTGDSFKTNIISNLGPRNYLPCDFKALKSPEVDKETGKLVLPVVHKKEKIESFSVAAKPKLIPDISISIGKKTADSLNKIKLAFEQLSLILGDLFNAAGNNTKS